MRECINYYNVNVADRNVMSEDEKLKIALNAAGRFKSGVKDLSVNHDKYLKEYFSG